MLKLACAALAVAWTAACTAPADATAHADTTVARDIPPPVAGTRTEPEAGSIQGYSRGSPAAPVVVVEFTDFSCRWCGELARSTLPVVDRELVATGQVRWIVIPVATASTPRAMEAAAAAECAAQQRQPWAMHDRLFANPREWVRARNPEPRFVAYARELGLDANRFASCYRDPRTADAVDGYRRLARQMGVRVAPTLFVNGRRVEGALPLEELGRVLGAAGATPVVRPRARSRSTSASDWRRTRAGTHS